MGQYAGQFFNASWCNWWFGDGHAAIPPPSFPMS
jgi:prepilin-type processing-associated H-X9-DG protein